MNFNINNLPKDIPNGSVQGYVTEEEIAKMNDKLKAEGKTGIIYNPEGDMDRDEEGKPIVNLVDVNDVLGNVEKILEYMCNDDIILMKQEDDDKYQNHMEQQFPHFSERYYTLFRTIIEGKEDLTHLFSMLGAIERIKKGEISIEKAEEELGKELAKDYMHKNTNTNSGKKNKKKRK